MDFWGRHECMLRLSTDIQDIRGKNIMLYKGAFGVVPFSMIETYCDQLIEQGALVRKKVRFVFVELAQNINRYSVDRDNDEGVGFISICQSNDGYAIVSGNMTSGQNHKRLMDRLVTIASLNNDKEELHLYKRRLMKEGVAFSENANIGLVQSAIVACSRFYYESVKTDGDKYFITLKIEIKVPELGNLY